MELRKDYILDRWVIVSEGREARPKQFIEQQGQKSDQKCFFCPGNESMTPPETDRVEQDGKWVLRSFPNKFSAVSTECEGRVCNPAIETHNGFFTFADAYGRHEVVVETNDHNKQLWDLTNVEIERVLKFYNKRIEALSKIPGIKYVNLFKNSGKDAGTSILHSHTQIIATAFLPKAIREELFEIKKRNVCPYCQILEIEKGSYRRCFENEYFVAFTPYASRFHYELWIMPKQHINSMSAFDDRHYSAMAELLSKALSKLKALNASYNFFVHYNEDKDFHFMLEITPRMATWAGFEESTDVIINSVSPETAAKYYRGELQ